MRYLLCGAALAAGIAATPVRAETHDACDFYIDSLPATMYQRGVYCLRANLTTAIASGPAISALLPNGHAAMVLDCNGFSIRGSAGPTTQAIGFVFTSGTGGQGTIRNCRVEGFETGIEFLGNGRVVDNIVDRSSNYGIHSGGSLPVEIAGNRVMRTGGSTTRGNTAGIEASGSYAVIRDNVVDGVSPGTEPSLAYGIQGGTDSNASVTGNRVRRVQATYARGIGAFKGVISDNHIAGVAIGVSCLDPRVAVDRNTFTGITGAVTDGCTASNTLVIE